MLLVQIEEIKFSPEAKESFILWSKNVEAWAHALEYTLFAKGRWWGCFIGVLSAGEGVAFLPVGHSCVAQGTPDQNAGCSISAQGLPTEASGAAISHWEFWSEVPGASLLHRVPYEQVKLD